MLSSDINTQKQFDSIDATLKKNYSLITLKSKYNHLNKIENQFRCSSDFEQGKKCKLSETQVKHFYNKLAHSFENQDMKDKSNQANSQKGHHHRNFQSVDGRSRNVGSYQGQSASKYDPFQNEYQTINLQTSLK